MIDEDLNLKLLSIIDKKIAFNGSPLEKSFLALFFYNACSEIGFEKLPSKVIHKFLEKVCEYENSEEKDFEISVN